MLSDLGLDDQQEVDLARYSKDEARDWAREILRGQWTTLMTPFTPDDEVDEPGLRANIRHIRSLGTSGAGCTWGMGEFWSLTVDERRSIYEIVADEAAGEWPIAAHVSHTSAKEMVALADRAYAVGFDLLIVAPPYFATRTEQQVIDFVSFIAENSQLGIMFYNSPQFGIVLSPQALQRLTQIQTVVGVKEASFDQKLSIDTHLLIGEDVIVSTPDEWILFKAREVGFSQQVMFANTSDWRFDSPGHNDYVQFIEKATRGDIDDAFYRERISPIKKISDAWWQRVVKKQKGVLPVPLCKYWGELVGMAGGHVRSPLYDLAIEEKEELKTDLEEVGSLLPVTASV